MAKCIRKSIVHRCVRLYLKNKDCVLLSEHLYFTFTNSVILDEKRIMQHFICVSAVCKITHFGVRDFPWIHGLILNELENPDCFM